MSGRTNGRAGSARRNGALWQETPGELAVPRDANAGDDDDFDPPEPLSKPWPALPEQQAFSGLAGDVVRLIDPHTEADPMAVLAQFLVAFGNCAGRHAFLSLGPRRHYANMNGLIVGRTSRARKGTAWSWVDVLFEGVDPGWRRGHVLSGLSSREGLLEQLQDFGDDKRLLAVEEEFSSVMGAMKREGNVLAAGLRQAFDTGFLRTMTRNKPLRVEGAHVSLSAHITGDELLSLMDDNFASGGIGNRIQFCCAKRSKLLPDGDGSPELGPLRQQVKRALYGAKRAGEVKRSPHAADLWRSVYERLTQERSGIYGKLTSRAEAQVLRLSLTYALLDQSRQIEELHLRAALSLWEYFDRSVAYIFGDGTGNRDADKLRNALHEAGDQGLGGREINDVFSGHLPSEKIAFALGVLQQGGYARPLKVPGKGRPATRWFECRGCGLSGQSGLSPGSRGFA
jgi:hypothetical protein